MTQITASSQLIQQEETDYRSAVSEALMQKIGGSINYLIQKAQPIGTIVASMLTEAQFQAKAGTEWVLCDGGSSAGSDYETLTSNSTVPDFRGEFLRGLDNGRGVDSGRTMGSTQSASTHNHQWSNATGSTTVQTFDSSGNATNYTGQNFSVSTGGLKLDDDLTAGSDTMGSAYTSNDSGQYPRNVAVNYFIKINE